MTAPQPRGSPPDGARPGGAGPPVLATARLVLRGFWESDRAAFGEINADPVVMRHYPAPLTREQSDELVDRVRAQWQSAGWGLWALERRDTGQFIGYAGLWPVRFDAVFPCRVEIGWRLAAAHWGHGFATEAAREALRHAFEDLHWTEVVSFTSVLNVRSRAVMHRVGMRHVPEWDFHHPLVPAGHALKPHVAYHLTRDQWERRAPQEPQDKSPGRHSQ